jgi:adenylate cyclase
VTLRAEIRRRYMAQPIIRRAHVVSSLALITINLAGALIVFALIGFVIPLPVEVQDSWLRANLVLILVLTLPTVAYGHACAYLLNRPVLRWVRARRQPTDAEKLWLLAVPRWTLVYHAVGWLIAVGVFATFNGSRFTPEVALIIAQVVAIAGVVASAMAYLVSERLLRGFAGVALRTGVPERMRVHTVVTRTMFAWGLGTAAPVAGLVLVGNRLLTDDTGAEVRPVARTIVILATIAFFVGGMMILLAARATSDPVRQLRLALAQVERGDLGATLPVYDATEIGLLQSGFNEMAEGLRERERMRDLFDRHVGGDVARAALRGGVQLRGEARYGGILFADVIGSTTLATEREPAEVVALLNRFFEIVIDVVHAHGGWINKFEGDAALAVWGIPLPMDDLEAQLLTAARELGARLQAELPEVPAGIGVTAGEMVAGNVGVAERYEYTVIGDPVTEASRLSEVAKKFPGRVVANAVLLESAGPEADHWEQKNPVRARGRLAETPIAVTRDESPRS